MTANSGTFARKSLARTSTRERARGGVADHLVLLKPRVMSLVVFTGAVGFALAPGRFDSLKFLATMSAIAAGAGACGALNMWWDADIDANMSRTAMRPIPRGAVPARQALAIGALLSIVSVAGLGVQVNWLSAALLALTIAIYIPLYTMVLKRRTPLNIVIGGAAGALPPVIGWAGAAGSLSAGPIALFALIFLWTPPHFWALAIARRAEYAKVRIPMLPVTHGVAFTSRAVLHYTIALTLVTSLPFLMRMSGVLYMSAAAILDVGFLRRALHLTRSPSEALAMRVFRYSIVYLMWLFLALLLDHYLPTTQWR